MNEPRYDVIAIGNAIVDVIAPCSDELIEELQLNRGGMTLVDTDRARELYDAMGPAREASTSVIPPLLRSSSPMSSSSHGAMTSTMALPMAITS